MALSGWLTIYCLLIAAISVIGGLLPMVIRFTHRRMQLATSAVAGFMLGVALLQLLPHALSITEPSSVGIWMTAGLLAMFFLERLFAYHHHQAPGDPDGPPVTTDAEMIAHCDLAPGDPIDHSHGHGHEHKLTWSGAAIGLILHSIIAGIALAASMQAQRDGYAIAPGFAVFLVILLHKPFDSMTLMTLVVKAGYRRQVGHLINLAFALAVPLGAVLLLLGLGSFETGHHAAVGCAVAFAAGVFLCVSLADLLPELQFHRHDRVKLSAVLLVGLACAWFIARMEESTHAHEEHVHPAELHGHEHQTPDAAPKPGDAHSETAEDGHDHEHAPGRD